MEAAEVSVFINCLILLLFFIYVRQCNGQSGSVRVIPLEVAPTPFCPGSGSEVLNMGFLSVRGCNEIEKRDKIGRMFKECRLDLLGLSETKLRREIEMSF